MNARAGLVGLAAWLCWTAADASAADAKDPLARARQLYNERQFQAAVAAADEARLVPERVDSADLIAALAYLERYRESAAAEDLSSARERLRRIDAMRLAPRERLELIIGLGQGLYFDDAPGAAAGVFDSILAGGASMAPAARERVLDWWASALDRDARNEPSGGPGRLDRYATYQQIRERMQLELGADPANATASYWLSAAAWAQGDHQAAWDSAMAGWVRAPLATDHGAALRGDLDRLVQRGIIPLRARLLSMDATVLLAEWDGFKERWSK
jgi:hypothetical protein